MTTPDATPGATTAENTARQDGGGVHAEPVPIPAGGVRGADHVPTPAGGVRGADHVPTPAGGVRGADQVDRMDPPPAGEGTTTGADGQTPAREQMRVDQGERSASAGREDDDALEQAAALGETSDPADGSLAGG